jgi:hypothetical protein
MTMTKPQVLSDETFVIEVERKKDGWMKGAGRILAYIIGGLGILLGLILMATIIGIFAGLGVIGASMALICGAKGMQKLECPHCKKQQFVYKTNENFTCAKCKKLTVINWR